MTPNNLLWLLNCVFDIGLASFITWYWMEEIHSNEIRQYKAYVKMKNTLIEDKSITIFVLHQKILKLTPVRAANGQFISTKGD